MPKLNRQSLFDEFSYPKINIPVSSSIITEIREVVEEVLGVFDGVDSYGTSYVLFFTGNKIIVASMEKASWASVLVISGIIVGFVILFVRDLIMFIVGIGVAVGVGVLFSPIDSFIRRISVSKLKRLAADEILEASKKNFEVPYSSVVEVSKKRIKTYVGGGHVWYMMILSRLLQPWRCTHSFLVAKN